MEETHSDASVYEKMLKPLPIGTCMYDSYENSQRELIIELVLSIGLKMAQMVIPGFEKYSIYEIEKEWERMLYSPPNFKFKPSNPPLSVPFSADEDFQLMLYLKKLPYQLDITNVNESCPCVHLFRSYASLLERLKEISYLGESFQEEILDSLVEEIAIEEMIYLSTMEKTDSNVLPCYLKPFRCLKPQSTIHVSFSDIDDEIIELERKFENFQPNMFLYDQLAILRLENISFSMKRSRISIGRSTDDQKVDVDLRFTTNGECIHYSRVQAIVSFLEDSCFYLENVGHCLIRVNGIMVPPRGVCKLLNGYIIDISDILIVFLINQSLITSIQNDLTKVKTKKTKPKTKKY